MSRAAANRIAEKCAYGRVPETTACKAYRHAWPNYGGLSARDRIEFDRDMEKYAVTAGDKEQAQAAVNWALREYGTGLVEDGDDEAFKQALLNIAPGRELSDFEHNLLVVAKGQSCERRTFGIAAYLV